MVKILTCFLASSMLFVCCSAFRPDAATSYAKGRELLRAGDYDSARDQFEAALRSTPGHEPSQIALLELMREVGQYEAGQKRADVLLATWETSGGLHLEAGRILVLRGDHAGAEKHLRRAQFLGGASGKDAAVELALLLESLGKKSEAEVTWRQFLDEYRRGSVRGSGALGNVALAAWRVGYAQDAKDIFLDATAGADVSLEALANFGYLFLEKYNSTDAAGVFRDCLKINKRFPLALLGMALAKKFENNDQAETFARSALEVNPNLVPALNLLAELRMQEENSEEALKEIRKAIAVNPHDLETLGLEAIYHDLRGDIKAFEQVEGKVLKINPSYGEFYHGMAESLVSRRKYREAVQYERKAIELDPRLWPAYASMGINLMRIGDLPQGREMIQKAFDGDSFNVWAFNTLDLLDQMDKFEQSKSDHFVFRISQEDKAALSRYVPRLAEEAYARLTQKYGFVPDGPIQVEIFPDHAGFAVRTLGLPGLGALGVCFGRVIAQDSPRARKPGEFNWGTTLWHEFTHVITLQMTKHNIPRWFSEGISVYEERQARPGWGDDLTPSIVKAYKEGKLLKVSELNAGMMRPKYPQQIEISYYQASLVCELIEQKFGFGKIKEALKLYAENLPTEEVFRRALGWDMNTLDREYGQFLDSRLKEVAPHLDFKSLAENEKAYGEKHALTSLLEKNPNDFFANYHMGLLLRRENAGAAAEVYLKKAEALFPEFVQGENPYQLLMDIYLQENRVDDALAQIRGWIRFDENSIAPLLRGAEIYRKKKDWASAARMLEQSVYIQPFDPEVHTQLGEAASEAGDWAGAVASYQVLLGLNPTDLAGAHFNLARAWLGYGKKTEAKREVLKALEIAPAFEKAQELLLRLTGSRP